MPNTPKEILPYPNPTDAVGNFNVHQKNLADKLDERLSVHQNSGTWKKITNLADYEERGNNLPGGILINTTIPATSATDRMVKIRVRGYTYSQTRNIIDLTLNFYMLNGTLFSYDVQNAGTMQFSVVNVMRKDSTNMLTIWMEPDILDGFWQYPKITVDCETSWSAITPVSQTMGWTITRQVGFTGHTILSGTNRNYKWEPLTLANGWVNYGGGHGEARYRRIGTVVEVQGLVKNGLASYHIAVLPPGYRPAATLIFPAISDTATGLGRVDVRSDGYIIHNMQGGTSYFGLFNIVFPLDGAF